MGFGKRVIIVIRHIFKRCPKGSQKKRPVAIAAKAAGPTGFRTDCFLRHPKTEWLLVCVYVCVCNGTTLGQHNGRIGQRGFGMAEGRQMVPEQNGSSRSGSTAWAAWQLASWPD